MIFKRIGRSYHMQIETAHELRRAIDVDETHWVATDAPTAAFRIDAIFLKYLDSDNNGRIMCDELRAGVEWLFAVLKDETHVIAADNFVPLDSIDPENPDGQKILALAEHIFAALKVPEAQADKLTLELVREMKGRIESLPVSEAGVILPAVTENPDLQELIKNIIDIMGGAEHPSGQPGLNQEKLDNFYTQIRDYLEWLKKGDLPAGDTTSDILPLGEQTSGAWSKISALREKIDDYFALCKAVAYEPKLAEQIERANFSILDVENFAGSQIETNLTKAPLAQPNAEGVLNFDSRINPAYAKQVQSLRSLLSELPDFDSNSLSAELWKQLISVFSGYQAWQNSKPADTVARLGREKLQNYATGEQIKMLQQLIAEGCESARILSEIRLAEKLLLFQMHILKFANNFISFPHLYDPNNRALFERGSLVIDGRRLNMAVEVADRNAHSSIAKDSNIFTIYIEATRGEGEKMLLALPVTSRGKGAIRPGKRGIFRDVDGNVWQAKIVDILENPISIREALVAPFKRLGKMISGKVESITKDTEKDFDSKASDLLAAKPGATPTPQAGPSKGLVVGGLVMGGGVALAALGSAIAYIVSTLSSWKGLLGLACVLVVLALVIIISATMKLRRRDLGVLLEACDWAVNKRMHLTFRQSRCFTNRPALPDDAKKDRGWFGVVIWLIVILALIGAGVGGYGWYSKCKAAKAAEKTATTQPAEICKCATTQPAKADDKTPASQPAAKPVEAKPGGVAK